MFSLLSVTNSFRSVKDRGGWNTVKKNKKQKTHLYADISAQTSPQSIERCNRFARPRTFYWMSTRFSAFVSRLTLQDGFKKKEEWGINHKLTRLTCAWSLKLRRGEFHDFCNLLNPLIVVYYISADLGKSPNELLKRCAEIWRFTSVFSRLPCLFFFLCFWFFKLLYQRQQISLRLLSTSQL